MNTEYRKKGKSDFEKDFYKLMNNSVFGKTMKNLRKRTDIKLVRPHEDRKMKKLKASPLFARKKEMTSGLAAIHMHKSLVKLDKPVYTILEGSKILMYDFYYNFMKKEYGPRCDLLYTDTDSLLFEVETEDFYKDMMKNSHLYDTSDYPADHPAFSKENKNVLRKMKDEMNGQPLAEVVCLKPKTYSMLRADDFARKKAKGVKKKKRSEKADPPRALQRNPFRRNGKNAQHEPSSKQKT